MTMGIGSDIIEISRIERACEKKSFLGKCFTESEIELFKSRNNKIETIAGNFAAKEAVSKAFGTGIGRLAFKDIEILRDGLGKPIVILSENGRTIADEKGISEIHITISHSKEYAVSFCIVE